MGSCAAPSAKGDDKFITTDYLQQCPEMRQELNVTPIDPGLQREIGLVLLRRDPQPLLLASALTLFSSLDLQGRVDSFLKC